MNNLFSGLIFDYETKTPYKVIRKKSGLKLVLNAKCISHDYWAIEKDLLEHIESSWGGLHVLCARHRESLYAEMIEAKKFWKAIYDEDKRDIRAFNQLEIIDGNLVLLATIDGKAKEEYREYVRARLKEIIHSVFINGDMITIEYKENATPCVTFKYDPGIGRRLFIFDGFKEDVASDDDAPDKEKVIYDLSPGGFTKHNVKNDTTDVLNELGKTTPYQRYFLALLAMNYMESDNARIFACGMAMMDAIQSNAPTKDVFQILKGRKIVELLNELNELKDAPPQRKNTKSKKKKPKYEDIQIRNQLLSGQLTIPPELHNATKQELREWFRKQESRD